MKCKPGDLAVIISDPDERNIGCFVRVDHPARDGEFCGPNDWACIAISPLFGTLWPVAPGETCGIDDRDLIPIRGKKDTASAKLKARKPCAAKQTPETV